MKRFLWISVMLGIGLLSLGAVVKKKDPIRDTQTDPIGYLEKAKQKTEGEKGPPAPTLELFPKESFLVASPLEKMKDLSLGQEESEAELWLDEELGEEVTSTKGDEFKLEAEADNTWEESES